MPMVNMCRIFLTSIRDCPAFEPLRLAILPLPLTSTPDLARWSDVVSLWGFFTTPSFKIDRVAPINQFLNKFESYFRFI